MSRAHHASLRRMEVSAPVLDQPLSDAPPAGFWEGDPTLVTFAPLGSEEVLESVRAPVGIVFDPVERRVGLARAGAVSREPSAGPGAYPLLGLLAPLYPEWLGDREFTEIHGLRFAYMGGSMARGIASTDLVIALAEVGALGMFGAAGLTVERVREAIGKLRASLDPRGLPWGCNLIHSLNEPALEEALVDLFLAEGVTRVEASAFMRLTPAVVRYACTGLKRGDEGEVLRERHLFAKISREEVARQFLSPAPAAMLTRLVDEGKLTRDEAELATRIPLANHLIIEGDSGGHTDNRILGAVLPSIARMRDDIARKHGYTRPVHLGAAGGLGTPEAVAAAFALGAAFVVVGSVHQAAVESGVSDAGRALLAQAGTADVAMTASADMFEMGVKVQVLTRGTMMATRGNQLYEIYRRHGSMDEISADIRQGLETSVFRMPLEEVWDRTRRFFESADPRQVERAERDPKHKLALVCRWYLGSSSRWPIDGNADRRADYQLWCGPAMGAFNQWTAGTFLEDPAARSVQQIALNLMEGAAAVTRAQQLRTYGLAVPPRAFHYQPAPLRLQ